MPRVRGGAGVRGRGGRGRGRGSFRSHQRSSFKPSRLDEAQDTSDKSDDESASSGQAEHLSEDEGAQEDSGSDEDLPTASSYQLLLQSLKAKNEALEPVKKKLKNSNGLPVERPKASKISQDGYLEPQGSHSVDIKSTSSDQPDERDEAEEEENAAIDAVEEASSDEDSLTDPFESHYANVEEEFLSAQITASNDKQWKTSTANIAPNLRRLSTAPSSSVTFDSIKRSSTQSFKKRLSAASTKIQDNLVPSEPDLSAAIFNYLDILFGARSLSNASRTRDIVSLHVLNHVFKTRDRVIKNNAKLAQEADGSGLDIRDQGFTRPKALILLPTRQACVDWVESIVNLSQPEQQENKARFLDNYSAEDQQTWDEKPEDFRSLFAGNIDDDFRIGLKFTRKTVKLFSSFYNSDIILASALGLMRAIEGTDSKDKKTYDADFLSSIEIAVIDHANATLMQNWQHVEYIFSQLNLLPKESHGCDFSRVRNWYLDGNAKYLRQTIILSDYLTPDVNALASAHLHNIAGRVKYTPTFAGAMLDLPPSLPSGTLSQTFIRFASPTPSSDSDARFTHFTTTILPTLLRHSSSTKGTLIFIPDYPSFLRLRNHLSTSLATASLSFATVSEYSSHRDVARARSHFLSGRHSVLLYTERAHHFRRFRIRGVRKVVFYGVPENPTFWGEVVGFVGLDAELTGESKRGKGVVRALFSRWDVMKLERIVGTERVGRLVSESRGEDVFDFV